MRRLGAAGAALALVAPAAPLAAAPEHIEGVLDERDSMRRISVLGSRVDSPYDCHPVRVGAGEGIRISVSVTGASRRPHHRVRARIGSADCQQVMGGLADAFASRTTTTVGVIVDTDNHGAVRLPYRLSIERFDAAAIERNRNEADAAFERGRTKLQARDYAGAIAELEQVTRILPESQETFFALGTAQHAQGDLSAAAANYARVLTLNGDSTEAERGAIGRLNIIGNLLLQQDNPAGAEAAFDAAHKFDREEVVAAVGLAVARLRQNKTVDLAALSRRLPLDGSILQMRIASADILERQASTNGRGDQAEVARRIKARAQAELEALPMILDQVSLSRNGDNVTLAGRLIGNSAAPGSRHSLSFVLGGHGLSGEMVQVDVTAPARGQAAEFRIERALPPGFEIRSYTHTPCPSC